MQTERKQYAGPTTKANTPSRHAKSTRDPSATVIRKRLIITAETVSLVAAFHMKRMICGDCFTLQKGTLVLDRLIPRPF